MSASFVDKVIYITGASSGIGQELARQLAVKGARIALFARRIDRLQALVSEIEASGGQAFAATCDVADRANVLAAFAEAARAFGPCDVLIANAGISYPVPAHRFDAAKARAIYEVNVHGALSAFEAVLPEMLRRGAGHIVGISSLAAYRSYPESHVYCSSKAALSAELEGLRVELRPRGIAVTTICPGFVRTDMTTGNTVPMPFLQECRPAAARIIGAIERRTKVYNFPRRLYWLVRLSRLVPEAVIARVTRPPKGRSYKETPSSRAQ